MGLFGFSKKKKIEAPETFKERRALPRWAISAKAKIKRDGQSDIDCEVRNLNMRGFAVVTANKIPPDCLHFTLYFNERFFFTVDVMIVWQKEAEGKNIYGIKFTRIRDADREKMYQMMRQDFPEHLEKYK